MNRVIESGCLVLGAKVHRFENSFAYCMGTKHFISVAHGIVANELPLRSLGIDQGYCAATVASTGMYTASAMFAVVAKPYFTSVELSSRNSTLAEVDRALTAGKKMLWLLACTDWLFRDFAKLLNAAASRAPHCSKIVPKYTVRALKARASGPLGMLLVSVSIQPGILSLSAMAAPS